MNRKRTILLIAAVFCLALLAAGCGSSDSGKGKPQVLNIYSWADYYDPEVLAEFEKQNNCKITYDVYSNNEELLAKMQAGGAQFDIIQPSDYMVTTMIKLGMLEKLDKSKIPNAANIAKDEAQELGKEFKDLAEELGMSATAIASMPSACGSISEAQRIFPPGHRSRR